MTSRAPSSLGRKLSGWKLPLAQASTADQTVSTCVRRFSFKCVIARETTTSENFGSTPKRTERRRRRSRPQRNFRRWLFSVGLWPRHGVSDITAACDCIIDVILRLRTSVGPSSPARAAPIVPCVKMKLAAWRKWRSHKRSEWYRGRAFDYAWVTWDMPPGRNRERECYPRHDSTVAACRNPHTKIRCARQLAINED